MYNHAMRVVSLTCSNTEIVCGLGMAHALVGVDEHSDYPPDVVNALPRVGPDLGIDIDAVAALKPDLVLASLTVPGHEEVVAGLERAGLNYMAPEPTALDDVYRDIVDIAKAMSVPDRADDLVQQMRDAIQPPTTEQHDGPTLLVQWWPKPVIAPGRQSWVNELLASAGARNPLIDRDVKSAPLEDAEVRELDPDAFVISWCGVKPEKYRPDVIYRNDAFAGMRAIENKRVYCVPEAWLGRPSQRLAEGAKAFREIVGAIQSDSDSI